jgi:hypothetical protein
VISPPFVAMNGQRFAINELLVVLFEEVIFDNLVYNILFKLLHFYQPAKIGNFKSAKHFSGEIDPDFDRDNRSRFTRPDF